MKKGFTLVELSIVLVIIGLLIGGILVAQSMIGTAKIQALIRQLGQFDAAVENFQTKYNSLPGDTTAMGCQDFSADGGHCGDGSIDYLSYNNDIYFDGLYVGGEMNLFWSNLSASGLTKPDGGVYPDCADSPCSDPVPGVTIPKSALNEADGIIAVSWHTLSPNNYYEIGQFGSSEFDRTQSVIHPSQMLAIDQKIDDGKAGTFGSKVFDFTTAGVSYTCDDGNGNYNLSQDADATCEAFIQFGNSTGNLH